MHTKNVSYIEANEKLIALERPDFGREHVELFACLNIPLHRIQSEHLKNSVFVGFPINECQVWQNL